MKKNYFLRRAQRLLLLLTLLLSLSASAKPLLNNHFVDKSSQYQYSKNIIIDNDRSFYNSKKEHEQLITIAEQNAFLHILLIATKKQSNTISLVSYVYNANLQLIQILNTAITISYNLKYLKL